MARETRRVLIEEGVSQNPSLLSVFTEGLVTLISSGTVIRSLREYSETNRHIKKWNILVKTNKRINNRQRE